MNSILAINSKFFEIEPDELIKIVKNNSKYTRGFEIYISDFNTEEIKYVFDLASICKRENMIFQVHGNSCLSVQQQQRIFKYLQIISDVLEYKINIVIHSISSNNRSESIELTKKYMTDLTLIADNNKLTISLENLNSVDGIDRLNKEDIIPIITSNEHLYLTYDIGHEIAEYGNPININECLIPIISNVHIHTTDDKFSSTFDHKPIYENNCHLDQIIKTIVFLKTNNYHGNIVFEYDLYQCQGNTVFDKILSYLKSIDFISKKIVN